MVRVCQMSEACRMPFVTCCWTSWTSAAGTAAPDTTRAGPAVPVMMRARLEPRLLHRASSTIAAVVLDWYQWPLLPIQLVLLTAGGSNCMGTAALYV